MDVHIKSGHLGPVTPSSSLLGIRVGPVEKQVKHDTPLATLTHVHEGWLYKSIVYGRVLFLESSAGGHQFQTWNSRCVVTETARQHMRANQKAIRRGGYIYILCALLQ